MCSVNILIGVSLSNNLIGASLSEPHTSVTSLRCVCLVGPCSYICTVNIKSANFHLHVHNNIQQLASFPVPAKLFVAGNAR